jgi:hypothetical protein
MRPAASLSSAHSSIRDTAHFLNLINTTQFCIFAMCVCIALYTMQYRLYSNSIYSRYVQVEVEPSLYTRAFMKPMDRNGPDFFKLFGKSFEPKMACHPGLQQ